jgi:thioredoxin reductase
VIRRGFWLAVGATGGIMGYRRAVYLGRRASSALLARGTTPGAPARGAPAPRTPWARGTTPGAPARGAPAPRRHWARETIRFARDVREGMDLYMARHPGRVGPNLGASARNEEKDER